MNWTGQIDWEHAFSRYMMVTPDLIDVLQRDFFAGRELGGSLPHVAADEAAVMVAESLEGDRLWNTLTEKILLSGPRGLAEAEIGRSCDFRTAVAAELMFSTADVARELNDQGAQRNWRALAMATLEQALCSPTASPLLWYQDIFLDVAEAAKIDGEGDLAEARTWLKQGLAHDVHFNEGRNTVAFLLDLSALYLQGGELDQGLQMATGLLRHDPAHIWTYNLIALSLDDCGLTETGIEAAKRGLALLDAEGDPEQVRGQLEQCVEDLATSEGREMEVRATPSVLAELRAALQLDFDAGELRPPEALCRELVPDFDDVPVKRPLKPSEFPLPNRTEVLEELAGPPGGRPAETPGRNDPCWCGSGKKYKYCHLREDQRRRR